MSKSNASFKRKKETLDPARNKNNMIENQMLSLEELAKMSLEESCNEEELHCNEEELDCLKRIIFTQAQIDKHAHHLLIVQK